MNTKSEKTVSDNYIESWRELVCANPYITENQWYQQINAENKQGIIPRKESDVVLRKLSMKAFQSEYKVLVIWMAEKMHVSAANALLKLIEEPPDKTVFLLISENTDQILPTILSRTQLIRTAPVSDDVMRHSLLEKYPDAVEQVEDVVRRAAGNFGVALQMMEMDEQEHLFFEEFVYLMRKCYGREIAALQKWVDKMAPAGREKLKLFLSYGLRMIRENFMLNIQHPELSYLSKKEHEFSTRFAAFIHQGNVHELAGEFEKAIAHIEANGYPKLVLFDLAVKLIFLLKKVPAGA